MAEYSYHNQLLVYVVVFCWVGGVHQLHHDVGGGVVLDIHQSPHKLLTRHPVVKPIVVLWCPLHLSTSRDHTSQTSCHSLGRSIVAAVVSRTAYLAGKVAELSVEWAQVCAG